MSTTVISIENLSKYYRLGVIGGGTLREDINGWWAKFRGKPDPLPGVVDQGFRTSVKGQVWALRNINLNIEEGDVVGIIGRNGAGKSTLLKILSRITAPTSGKVTIRGRIGSLLEVGTGFHPELTGRENIFLNGTILGMQKAEVNRKFENIIEFAEIAKFVDTPVKRYSSGMTVRLAFAVAAHLEPEILIVDEVLAVGDVAFQNKCIKKIHDVSSQGRTVLFVSHNMVSIDSLCSRGVLLSGGVLKFQGTASEAVSLYIKEANIRGAEQLKNRDDRKGIGVVRLQEITISNSTNEASQTFRTGTALRFAIKYSSKEKLTRVRFVIGVYDFLNVGVLRFDTDVLGVDLSLEPGEGIIECLTDEVALSPGSYFINVAILRNGVFQDYIERAAYLNFVSSDFFGTGRAFSDQDAKLTKCLVRHKWRIVNVDS